jgi:hypothetical protein
MDLDRAYQILEVPPTASLAEIKQAYRELARVWHPDRFPPGSLHDKAQERLKQLNLAYEQICSRGESEPRRPYRPRPESSERRENGGSTRSHAPPRPPAPTAPSPSFSYKRSLTVVLTFLAVFGASLLFLTFSRQAPRPTTSRSVMESSYVPVTAPTPYVYVTKRNTRVPTENLSPSGLALSTTATSAVRSPIEIRRAEPVPSPTPWVEVRRATRVIPTPPDTSNREFFTLGSTKDDVLAIQGSPTSFPDSLFHYDYSTVQFRDDKVVSWNSSYPPLKAKLLPKQPAAGGDFFTIGSTRDDVLAIQGSPTSFTDSLFHYDYSTVQFRDGKVVSWNSSYPPLKAKLLPNR